MPSFLKKNPLNTADTTAGTEELVKVEQKLWEGVYIIENVSPVCETPSVSPQSIWWSQSKELAEETAESSLLEIL